MLLLRQNRHDAREALGGAASASLKELLAVNPADSRPAGTKDQVTFTRHGNEYALTTIWDSAELSGVTTIQPKPGSPHHHAH